MKILLIILFATVTTFGQRNDIVYYPDFVESDAITRREAAREINNPLRLPVMFHIWDNENRNNYVPITDSIIDSQIDALCRDFSPWGIQYQRTIIDGESNPSNGIIRYTVPIGEFDQNGTVSFNYIAGIGNDSRMEDVSAGRSFINVHVGPIRGVLGLAFGNGSIQGVLINAPAFGIREEQGSFDEGKTCTHEIGHWLGLRHTFVGGCGDGSGDEVGDTPPVDVQFGCGWSGCGNYNDTNYMNYHDDRCMDHFTEGQLERAKGIILTYNPYIISSPGAGYLRCGRVTDLRYHSDTITWNESLINTHYTVRIRRGVNSPWKKYESDSTYFDIGFIPETNITYYEVKVKAHCRLHNKTKQSEFIKYKFVR